MVGGDAQYEGCKIKMGRGRSINISGFKQDSDLRVG